MSALHTKLQAAREKMQKFFADAKAIREELGGLDVWPADKEEKFQKVMKDLGDAQLELQGVEAQIKTMEQLDETERFFKDPVRRVATRAADQPQNHGANRERDLECLTRYVKTSRKQRVYLSDNDKQAAKRAIEDGFDRFIREGLSGLSPAERHIMLSSQDNVGGFLVPEEMTTDIIMAKTNATVMRGMCTVRKTSRGDYPVAKVRPGTDPYNSTLSGTWRNEGYVSGGTAPGTQEFKTDLERIPVHTWAPNVVEIPMELLEDSDADIESIIVDLFGTTQGQDEDLSCIAGNGVKRPQGIVNSGAGTKNTGSSGAVTFDGLVDLTFDLPAQYFGNASYLMHNTTLGAIMKLKDSQNMPLISPYQARLELYARPIKLSPHMPTLAAAAKCVVFGDFSYYWMVERRGLVVQRLDERFAPNTGILVTQRLGGQCVLPEAFRIHVAS